jgi:hypothetical protein
MPPRIAATAIRQQFEREFERLTQPLAKPEPECPQPLRSEPKRYEQRLPVRLTSCGRELPVRVTSCRRWLVSATLRKAAERLIRRIRSRWAS